MKLWFNLFCRDIDAQLAWYQALLHLPEAVQARSPIYRAVEDEHFQFGFNALPAYALLNLSTLAPTAGQATAVTAYATFMLPDTEAVEQAAHQAVALGGRVIKPPYPSYYGQWQAVLADPEGHVFRVAAVGLPAGVPAPPEPF